MTEPVGNELTEASVEAKETESKERAWLTVPEAAEELHIPRTRCYELIAQGALPAVRIGERSIRVHGGELERFLLEQRRVIAQ